MASVCVCVSSATATATPPPLAGAQMAQNLRVSRAELSRAQKGGSSGDALDASGVTCAWVKSRPSFVLPASRRRQGARPICRPLLSLCSSVQQAPQAGKRADSIVVVAGRRCWQQSRQQCRSTCLRREQLAPQTESARCSCPLQLNPAAATAATFQCALQHCNSRSEQSWHCPLWRRSSSISSRTSDRSTG